ncbi:DUF5017 domain-containing protein [Pedobacter sp. ASV1-7]|jgi:hypothetical protein|uniref:DUF5017 domain-containing protein n=1 Tax=Pedobacter sp. ASV1-7 TaxID=3145237 RepID=UPI0032E92C1F
MKIKYLILLLLAFQLCACDKSLDVKEPKFDVTTDKTTYKVGDNIQFNISGDAKYITFYSGEDGSNRDFISAPRMVAYDKLNLYYTIWYQRRLAYPQVSILVSTNFTGDRANLNDVKAATWIDITDRYPFLMGQAALDGHTASNRVDISDIVKPGDKMNFAFKYIKNEGSTSFATVWLSKVNLAYSKGLSSIDIGGETGKNLGDLFLIRPAMNENKIPDRSDNRWYTRTPPVDNIILWANSSNTTIDGKAYTTTSYQEEYWVSKSFDIAETFEIQDVGLPLKGYSDSRVNYHTWTYTKPGTYKVVFEGSNATIKQTITKTKEIILTITE